MEADSSTLFASGSTTIADESNERETQGQSFHDIKANHTSKLIFKDMNPEADCRTAFERRLSYAGGRCNLTDSGHTPQEVIDAQLARCIEGSHSTVRDVSTRYKGCRTVVSLSYPKGMAPLCDLCPEKAKLCCLKCNATYYCSMAHKSMDTLHDQLCKQIQVLKSPPSFGESLENRTRQDAQKLLVMEKLVEDLTMEGLIGLYKGNFHQAIGLFRQGQQYISRVYGEGNEAAQHVSVYTAISEAQVRLNMLKAADESINLAMYYLTMKYDHKEDKKSDSNKLSSKSKKEKKPKEKRGLNYSFAQINRGYGLLKYAKSNFQDAAFYFAECIYYVSETTSPTDIRTCSGYLNLAKCLLGLDKMEEGLAMSLFCVGLWETFLYGEFKKMTANTPNRFGNMAEEPPMSIIIELEANRQIETLYTLGIMNNRLEISNKALLCKGMMLFFNKKFSAARDFAHRAMELENKCNVTNIDFITLCKHLEKHAARNEQFFDQNSSTPVS